MKTLWVIYFNVERLNTFPPKYKEKMCAFATPLQYCTGEFRLCTKEEREKLQIGKEGVQVSSDDMILHGQNHKRNTRTN